MFVIIFCQPESKSEHIPYNNQLAIHFISNLFIFIASLFMKIELCDGRKRQVDYKTQSLSANQLVALLLKVDSWQLLFQPVYRYMHPLQDESRNSEVSDLHFLGLCMQG